MKRIIFQFLFFFMSIISYGQTHRLAILDLCSRNFEIDKENLASAIHMAEVAGMPYLITDDISLATAYPFILITSSLRDETLQTDETLVLKNFVNEGGILIAPFIKSTYYFDLFGINYTKLATTRYWMTWDTISTHPELCWVNEVMEKKLPMADSEYYRSISTRGYTPELATVLASFEDSTAAITVNNYGSGKAYAFGFELKDIVLRNLLNRDYNAHRIYSNGFEPTTDMFLLFLRAVYTSNRPIAVYKHSSPGISTSALLITHDVDSRTGIDSLFFFSEWEANNGIKAHYFVTTHYYRDDWLSDFYNPTVFPKLMSILENGHVIGSHSVGHFPDFADEAIFPLGEAGNTQENYQPAYTDGSSAGGTVTGELEVSRNLLNNDIEANVRSFRAGHLAFNNLLIDGMSNLNYAFNSSNSANDVLTNFPYRQRTGNAFSGIPTEVYEMPMTISDASSTFPITETTIDVAVGNWLNVINQNDANNAPTVLLIHPNRAWKLGALEQLMENKPPSVIPYEFNAFGDYWLERRDLDFDYSIADDTLRIQFVNDKPISEEQSIVIVNGRNLASIALFNFSGEALVIQTETWKENDLLITHMGPATFVSPVPIVITQTVSDIDMSTALGYASISDLGPTYSTQHGLCWSTSINPTTLDSHSSHGAINETGDFTSPLTGLSPFTTYYARAYVTNAAGTFYGNQVSFTTLPEPAMVSTQEVTDITSNSAIGKGTITDLGIPMLSAYGFCWNTIGNPTIDDYYSDEGTSTTLGEFSSPLNSLSSGTTYFVRAYATNAAGTFYGEELSFTTVFTLITWTGASSTDWWTASNWYPEIIPVSQDVLIPSSVPNYPIIGSTMTATCGNLSIEADASLTIQSDEQNTGSFIFGGAFYGAGNIIYQRFLAGNQWHMLGSPLTGQSISSFLSDGSNSILFDDGIYSMKHYIENPDSWSADYTLETAGDIELGIGYELKRSSDGLISLTGTPNNSSQSIPIMRVDDGWNLLSNPFTSSVAATIFADAENNLLSGNTSALDENYVALYIWDEDPLNPSNSNNYKIINQTGGELNQHYLQTGQGFFVKSALGGGGFSFSPAMQSHQTAIPLKSDLSNWTIIKLSAASDNSNASTHILYNESMRRGLDIGYDAGLLSSYPDFSLYSRFLDDQGVNFAIQCLPADFEQLVVPLGLDANAGELISFTASSENLSEEYAVILEDRVLNIFTNLSEDGAEYSIQLLNDISGPGRFFVHTVVESTIGIIDVVSEKKFQVLPSPKNSQLLIYGDANTNTSVQIFSIVGTELVNTTLINGRENQIFFDEEAGIYIVKIRDKQTTFTQKFTWVKY